MLSFECYDKRMVHKCMIFLLAASNSTSNQSGDGRGQHDHPLHCHGNPHAHHIPVHIRKAGAAGHNAPHGDGHTQRNQGHGPDIMLCRQWLRNSYASLQENYHQP